MSEPVPEIPEVEQDKDFERDLAKDRGNAIRKRKIRTIYRHGFPADTPYKTAVVEAMQAAELQHPNGKVIRHAKEQTPEHEENNEYLIVLYIVEKKDTDDKPKEDAK